MDYIVYLAESPRVKIAAARDVPLIIKELESILTDNNQLIIRCGHICGRHPDACEARCPRCVFNVLHGLSYCRSPRANMKDSVDF